MKLRDDGSLDLDNKSGEKCLCSGYILNVKQIVFSDRGNVVCKTMEDNMTPEVRPGSLEY